MLIDMHTDRAHVDAEHAHTAQRIATLEGELAQAREQVAALTAETGRLQDALKDERDGHAFYMAAFSDKCKEAKR